MKSCASTELIIMVGLKRLCQRVGIRLRFDNNGYREISSIFHISADSSGDQRVFLFHSQAVPPT